VGGLRGQSGSCATRTIQTTSPASSSGTQRRDFESYLAWRTARGFTATFEAMLTQRFVIYYYDVLYPGTGIAAEGALEEGKA
jgi:hypothetical protein